MKRLFYILFLISVNVSAQRNVPLNREWSLNYERIKDLVSPEKVDSSRLSNIYFGVPAKLYVADKSCFKPYITGQFRQVKGKSKPWYMWFPRKIKKESFFLVNDSSERFHFTADPIINFELGIDAVDKTHERLYKNTRGFVVRGDLGNKISFESSFYENQATYAKYLDDYIASTNALFPQVGNYQYAVIPGQGRSKKFKTNGYDYAMTSGYLSYTPNKYLNVQLGHGKHFVGDGYRSLLLSDNAFNYPYARITATYKGIQYTNLYTSFMNLTNGGVKTPPHVERLFQKKTGSFQLLSFNLWKRLQIGLFQGMIWEAADTNNREHVNFNTFDPVIGVNTAIYGLHDKNNILCGATFKLKVINTISVYGQFMLDDVTSNSTTPFRQNGPRSQYGYQAGLKYYDVFTIKNLHLQLEYNSVRPYSYSAEDRYQSYSHYNQSLAHPLGANFNEAVGFLNYSIKDFFIQLKGNYAVKGLDSTGTNYGGNIFKPFAGMYVSGANVSTTQGFKTTIITEDLQIGYLINRATNMNIVAGLSIRNAQVGTSVSRTEFVYLALRTSLSNFYYDF